jgi:hypothetical protein
MLGSSLVKYNLARRWVLRDGLHFWLAADIGERLESAVLF